MFRQKIFLHLSNTCVSFSFFNVSVLDFYIRLSSKRGLWCKVTGFHDISCHISGIVNRIKQLIFVNCLIHPFKLMTLILLASYVRYPQQRFGKEG